jgi:crotonobetainyl-CoA:carnitine CoA-transferase CaiB-like acyl-CoA transferase
MTLSPTGVPCGRVNTPHDILTNVTSEQLALFESVDDGMGGTIRSPANPFGFDPRRATLPTVPVNLSSISTTEGNEGSHV